MQQPTNREIAAARTLADAALSFLIAYEDGQRSRLSERPKLETGQLAGVHGQQPTLASDQQPPSLASDQGRLIPVEEVAALLGCSRRHVWRLSESGRLPNARRIGAIVRWSLEELRQWIKDGSPADSKAR